MEVRYWWEWTANDDITIHTNYPELKIIRTLYNDYNTIVLRTHAQSIISRLNADELTVEEVANGRN